MATARGCPRRWIEPALFVLMTSQLLYWAASSHWPLRWPLVTPPGTDVDPPIEREEDKIGNNTDLIANPDCHRNKSKELEDSTIAHGRNNFIYNAPGMELLRDTKFILPSPNNTLFFAPTSSGPCFKLGTGFAFQQGPCTCSTGWSGRHCSIPSLARWASFTLDNVVLRPTPRRIIHGFPFNDEFDLLEIKLEEMGDATDVFLVVESNYTNHGDPKDRVLLHRLRHGFLHRWHHKLVYLALDHFPSSAREDGWVGDELPRTHAVLQGLRVLDNVQPDDLFLLTDVDEVVRAEVLWFLKLHQGFPTPLGLALWQTMYGYQWRARGQGTWSTVAAVPVSMIRQVIQLRGSKGHSKAVLRASLHKSLEAPLGSPRWTSQPQDHFAGWHCAWCLRPWDIRRKLCSAIAGDFPRWGDDPEKTRLSYIKDLVREGRWFDDLTSYVPVSHRAKWTPQYVTKHPVKFAYLLDND